MVNMLILAVADLAVLRRRTLTRIAVNQSLVGVLAIALTVVAAAGLVTGNVLVFGRIGWAPMLVMLGYFPGMRLLHLNRGSLPFKSMPPSVSPVLSERPDKNVLSLRRAALGFTVAAAVILVAANFLANLSATVADQFGLTKSFIGVTLAALTTSLPEVTVTLASIRCGAYDMAVGNPLGSNCFNMAILIALDIVDGNGSVLTRAEAPVLKLAQCSPF